MTDTPAETCIFEPWGSAQVALIHSTLSGTDIKYHIENEAYSHMASGVDGIADARTRLFVETSRAQEARELIQSALGKSDEE